MLPPASRLLRRAAPAKINLHLRVGPPRKDGFHSLLSWFATVGMFDTLQMTIASAAINQTVMTCSDPALPTDARNLVVRAAELFRERYPSEAFNLSIHLTKQVPSGGGLGGGSSDAATTLLMLAEHRGDISPAYLLPLASRLGSDVPFFLFGSSSVCTGRGEIVRPIGAAQRVKAVVLVLPAIAMPTADVYRRFDAMKLGNDRGMTDEPDWAAWRTLAATDLLPLLVNDLEGPAFSLRPDLAALRNAAAGVMGRPVRMSGSGSTLFTLFDDPAEAERAAARVQDSLAVTARAVALGAADVADVA